MDRWGSSTGWSSELQRSGFANLPPQTGRVVVTVFALPIHSSTTFWIGIFTMTSAPFHTSNKERAGRSGQTFTAATFSDIAELIKYWHMLNDKKIKTMSRVFLALFWRPRTFSAGGDVIIRKPQGGTIEQVKWHLHLCLHDLPMCAAMGNKVYPKTPQVTTQQMHPLLWLLSICVQTLLTNNRLYIQDRGSLPLWATSECIFSLDHLLKSHQRHRWSPVFHLEGAEEAT